MMKVTLRFSSLILGLMLWSFAAWAQPANDLCSGAIPITIGKDEASAIKVNGDTRGVEDASIDGIPVCSGNFYRDDVWYTMTAPDTANSGYIVKVYYTPGTGTDIPAFGIALYYSCDADASNVAFVCLNQPADDQVIACIDPGQTAYIRVWSAAGDATNWEDGEGTFKIAAFSRTVAASYPYNVLWGNQPGEGDFAGGLNNWTTESVTCGGAPDPVNALWTWTASALPYWNFIDQPPIAPINSNTYCNGAMIFDSGLLDLGTGGNPGEGPCPQDQEGSLISPIIDVSQFGVFGVSVVFNQSMLRFSGGLHFVDYSVDGGATWTENEINSDYTQLSQGSSFTGYYNEEFRLRLPGAQTSSQLRLRFRFQGGYYWWVIDDVRIVETEANNLVAQKNFYAIPPWATIPSNQVYPYYAENDILNNGAGPQTNVVLNHKIKDVNTKEVIYNESLNYGTLAPDSLAENTIFPVPVVVPSHPASYLGTYTVTQDQTDFDPSNNVINFNFDVGGDMFAHETGATRSVAVANSAYDTDAPLSYGYGNIFRPVADVQVSTIQWGFILDTALIDKSVNILLMSWVDNNNDQISEVSERKVVSFVDYTFTGTEGAPGDNIIIDSPVDNFENPGDPVIMKAGFNYIAMVEYVASTSTDPQFFLLASEDRHYSATVLASDSAFVKGKADHRIYMTALEFSPDGVLANVDIEVKDLSTTDTRVHFGDDIVPVIRLGLTNTNTVDQLPTADLINVYPNPAKDNVQVKLQFEKPYDNVRLRLVDNLGRMVYHKELPQTISSHIESIRTADFAAGNYLLQVETKDGQRSIPVVIVK